LVLAVLTLVMVSAVTAADDPTQRVQFVPGTNSVSITGTVSGYRSLRYLLAAHAGQVLSTSFTPSKKTLYYNVLQGTRTLRDGSEEDNQDWSAALSADGDYVIDVYFKSGDARKNAQATFVLVISLADVTVNYRCADGSLVAVTYFADPVPGKARVVVADKVYELPHVVSGSGARYSNGKVTWSNKGSEGTLELNGPVTLCAE